VLPPLTYADSPLPAYADEINLNGAVLDAYCGAVLGLITEPGDDNNYGSSVLNDVACLQALSKRVHFGKFVAEAKYREAPGLFDAAIAARDGEAIMAALTYPQQEAAVAARVARKAATFGASVADLVGSGAAAARARLLARSALWLAWLSADAAAALHPVPPAELAGSGADPAAMCRVTPEAVSALWCDVVMPLTKQVQVAYLLRRGEAREAPGQPGRFAQGQARGTGPPGGFI
jgi:chorismate mutase